MSFIEVPVGSQSSRAMASYGICIGILGVLRAQRIPFMEITASNVKKVMTGSTTATKKDMIDAAVSRYPDLNWPRYTKKGITQISSTHAEHMADAMGAVIAGTQSEQFNQLLSVNF